MKTAYMIDRINRMPEKLKLRGFRGYFTQILISFLLVILIPVVTFSFLLYLFLYEQAKANFYEQQSSLVESISTNIYTQIDSIQQELSIKRVDPIYANYNRANSDTNDLFILSRDLNLMDQKYPIINSIYFYDLTSDRILNTSSGIYSFESFYDISWHTDIQNTSQIQYLPVRHNIDTEFYESIPDLPCSIYQAHDVFSLAAANYPNNIIVTNISIRALYQNIGKTYSLGAQDNFMFVNENNEVIYDASGIYKREAFDFDLREAIDSNEMPYIHNGNAYFMSATFAGKIICVISYPTKSLIRLPGLFIVVLILSCIALTGFLFVVAYRVTKKLYKPIDTLYSEIQSIGFMTSRDSTKVRNEIHEMSYVFKEMKEAYASSSLELTHYKKIAKASAMRMFLTGLIDYKLLVQDNPDLNYNSKYDSFVLMHIQLSQDIQADNYSRIRLLLHKISDVCFKAVEEGMFIEIDHSQFVIILRNQVETRLSPLIALYENALGGFDFNYYHISVSDVFHNFRQVQAVYQKCIGQTSIARYFSLAYGMLREDDLIPTAQVDYNQILNFEAALIRAVISQDQKGCSKIICDLSNLLINTKDVEFAETVCQRILLTLDKEFLLAKEELPNLCYENPQPALESRVRSITYTCLYCFEKYESNQIVENQYCIEAKKYIERHYMDNIEISSVAEYLNLSYSYLSKIFKANIGLRMSEYLNKIRIEKSKDYLCETNMTLNEIAVKIGYNNSQSFQRFFRKYENLSPGDYRKHYRKNIRME